MIKKETKRQLKNLILVLSIAIIPWTLYVFLYEIPWINSWPGINPETTVEEFYSYAIGQFIIVMFGTFCPLLLLMELSSWVSKKLGLLKEQQNGRNVSHD